MRFPTKKNAGCPKGPRDFPPRKDGILYPPSGCLGTSLPLPQSLCGRTDVRTDGCTDGRSRDYYVRTKISWIDSLPNFLSYGAPLAGFAHRLRYYKMVSVYQKFLTFKRYKIKQCFKGIELSTVSTTLTISERCVMH